MANCFGGRGDIALITRSTFSDAAAPWTLEQVWTDAHVGVVRSVLWDEQVNPSFPTVRFTWLICL